MHRAPQRDISDSQNQSAGLPTRCSDGVGTRSKTLALRSFCVELRQLAVGGLLNCRYFVYVCISSASSHLSSRLGFSLLRIFMPQIDS